jgi:hypothetical protein
LAKQFRQGQLANSLIADKATTRENAIINFTSSGDPLVSWEAAVTR